MWTSHRLALLMSVLVLSVGCGASSDESELEQQNAAIAVSNGAEFNGMKFNGMKFNGMKFNGMKFNGMKFNGTSFGSISLQNTSLGNVTLSGTSFSGTRSDGVVVHGTGFIGVTLATTLVSSTGTTSQVTLGIQNIVKSADPEIYDYTLVAQNSTGTWSPVCVNSAGQQVPALPVAGVWRSDGSKDTTPGQFTFACKGVGAVAKCVQMGYKPWQFPNHHQACIRMVRADYCGNGTSYTVDGNVIDVYDNLGIQVDDHTSYTTSAWAFDATWGPNGATCISLLSRPGLSTDDHLPTCYLDLFASCDRSATFAPGTLLKNWFAKTWNPDIQTRL